MGLIRSGRVFLSDTLFEKNMKYFLLALTISLFTTAASAEVTVTEPWMRATVPLQKATGVFMHLTAEQNARLVEVRTPIAEVAQVHKMVMENDIMKMRAVTGLDLPAGQKVELKPGGYHIMFLNLRQQIKEGDIVPITLVIEHKNNKHETIELKVSVQPLNGAANTKH